MKTPLLTLLCAFCAVYPSMAQRAHSTNKVEKYLTARDKAFGTAICQVNFNLFGDIKNRVMTKSTGSPALDEKIMATTGEKMHGGGSSVSFPIPYKRVEVTTLHGKVAVLVAFPHPPYPFQAKARHAQGTGLVRASFDEKGNVVKVVMEKSTGSEILDGNSVNYALARWKSSGGEKVTTTIELVYQIR